MKYLSLLIFCCYFNHTSLAQTNQYSGKIFISDSIDELHFKNDSVVEASFYRLGRKYNFRNDSLILTTDAYGDGDKFKSYKVIFNHKDSLFLVSSSHQNKVVKNDTFRFITIVNRIIKIKDFQMLRVDEYGTWGSKRLIIKNDKSVEFSNGGYFLPSESAINTKFFKLNTKKYTELLDTLAKSLIFMLPIDAGRSAIMYDPTFIDFTIITNGQEIVAKNVGLPAIHFDLYKYLITELAEQK